MTGRKNSRRMRCQIALTLATTVLLSSSIAQALPSDSNQQRSSSSSSIVVGSSSPYEQSPYLAYPPRTVPKGHAFDPNYTSDFLIDPGTLRKTTIQSEDNNINTKPLQLDSVLSSASASASDDQHQQQGTSPAFAWDRHPLGKRRAQPEDGTTLDPFHPGRLSKRAAIQISNAPFPASAYINVNNLTSIALVAQAAIARMQTWYEDGVFEWTGWWQTPVLGIAYTQLDLALGNNVNELLIKDLLIRNDDEGWMIDKYIDDQSWWGMFALRAHQAYPNQTWFEMVQTINNNNTLYWDDTCGGGVLWLTYRPQIKNTITNGLYFSILTRLYRYTGNETYFDYSMNTLNWWLGWAFDVDNGRVWDTITGPDCKRTGEATWTYNSGAFLFGLADLWYATGNDRILDLARTIAYAGIRDFSDPKTGVLTEQCENDPPPAAGKPPGCQQDETVFKGIFMLGLAELYLARPDPNIYNFINTQLLTNVYNNVDNSWLFGMWWAGPWNETTAGPKTQINAICAIAAAATVNADYLAHAGADVSVTPLLQIAVPDNTSRSTNAGSTAHDTGSHSAASSLWTSSTLMQSLSATILMVFGLIVLV